MRIKKIGVDTNYATYEELKQRHVVAQGWNEFGDLSFLQDVSEKIDEYLPRITYGSQGGKNTFNQLFRKIRSGDIVLALEGNQIKGIAEIPSRFIYYYDADFDYSNSLFPVFWIDWNVFCKDSNLMSQGGQGAPGIVDCGLSEINNYISEHWESFKDNNKIDVQPKQCEEKLEELIRTKNERIKQTKIDYMNTLNSEENTKAVKDLVENVLIPNHNLILTGAPGTGKTYLAKQIAQQMIFGYIKEKMNSDEEKQFNEQCGFVQFHPSYDYTDFVEGLRPIPNGLGSVGFKLSNGVFKDFCTKALQNFEDSKKTQQVLVEQQSFEDKYNEVVNKINDGSITEFELKTAGMKMEVADVSNRNSIILRTPGTTTNRTYTVSFKRIAVLAKAYPNVASLENMSNIYDSIQGVIKGCNASAYWAVLKEVYKQSESEAIEDTQQGGEKELQQEVKEKPFVFIIDEINRGEISKIFGELFFSIDPGYRGKDGEVRTQYANMQKEEANDFDDVLGITDPENYGHFFVPENVYIIGTMNDIDRSVESMDFAFRRRFAFKEIKAKDTQTMLDNEKAWGKDSAGNYTLRPDQTIIDEIKKKMESLNNTIWNEDNKTGLEGLSAAYHIGASYFLKLVNYKKEDGSFDYDKLWNYHLEGLLREYLRGMQDVDNLIDKLRTAYNNDPTPNN